MPLFLSPARLKPLIGGNKAILAHCVIEKGRLKLFSDGLAGLLSILLIFGFCQFDFQGDAECG